MGVGMWLAGSQRVPQTGPTTRQIQQPGAEIGAAVAYTTN
jgi:hypothetical protein